jgi:ribosomal protein S27AE
MPDIQNTGGDKHWNMSSSAEPYQPTDDVNVGGSIGHTEYKIHHNVLYAYWDYQNDGTHFCSECGKDALFSDEGFEFLSNWCPHCGRFMTEVSNNDKY